MAAGPFELELQNDAGEEQRLAVWLRDLAREQHLPARVTYNLDLVLHEVVANIIKHGLRREEKHTIQLSLQTSEDFIEVTVADPGPPFNPLAYRIPTQLRSLDDARGGGRGLSLIRKLTQMLEYERRDERNYLTLYFRHSSAGQRPH